jgi:hypothetical protein
LGAYCFGLCVHGYGSFRVRDWLVVKLFLTHPAAGKQQ